MAGIQAPSMLSWCTFHKFLVFKDSMEGKEKAPKITLGLSSCTVFLVPHWPEPSHMVPTQLSRMCRFHTGQEEKTELMNIYPDSARVCPSEHQNSISSFVLNSSAWVRFWVWCLFSISLSQLTFSYLYKIEENPPVTYRLSCY